MEYVVNVNYRGSMKKRIDLKKVNAPNSRLYAKPRQLVIKNEKRTLILFSSGRFKIMGCVDELDAHFLALKYTFDIDCDDIPDIYSQSYTSSAKLGYVVNLNKLSHCKHTLYEPELFGALRMTKYNPVSVNVFSTGSVVACGLKEPEDMYIIIKELDELLSQ